MQQKTTIEKTGQFDLSEGFHWKAKKDRRGWWLLAIYLCPILGMFALMKLFSWADQDIVLPIILMFVPFTTMWVMIKKRLLSKPFWGRYIAMLFFTFHAIFFFGTLMIFILLYIPAYYNYFFK